MLRRLRLLPLRQSQPSLIYFDSKCAPCREVATWLRQKHPLDLQIENADPSLTRVTYRYPDGTQTQGVEAIASALSHLHLGWAYFSWIIRLPLMLPLAEIAFGNAFKTPNSCPLDT